MLVQSTAPSADKPGRIELLPMLPPQWSDGSASGLCARGGFEVSIKWHEGKLTRAEIKSAVDRGRADIIYGDKSTGVSLDSGATQALDGLLSPLAAVRLPESVPSKRQSWTADNGNGTYSNPLFYEEFEDPDVIRVGDDYYLAGTTMHMNPGLMVMHSKDLVNWELASYCIDRLDLRPAFHLEGGNIYGQGIWAPCIRYHDGMFYVFSNVNRVGTQVFRSKSPNGPWERNELPGMHDLSVLFDDDGKSMPSPEQPDQPLSN